MRNYLILIVLFFSFYNAIGQGVTVPFTNPKATILGKGYFVTDSGIRAFTPMVDTVVKLWVPRKYDTGTAVLFQGLPYYHNGNKWILISTGGYVFDTTYIYQALADTAAAIRGDFPTMDSALFATNYRLDTTRYNLYAAILNSTFDTTYIYQALSDTTNNIRSDLSDSLALKVYLADSNIVYVSKYGFDTSRTTINSNINSRVKYTDSNSIYATKYGLDTSRTTLNTNIGIRVKYSDSVNTFVTPTMLNDTASAIRGAIPSLTGYLLKSDSTIYATLYRLDSTRTGVNSRIALKINIADSATVYVTPKRLADTATVLRGLIPTVPTIYYQTMKRNGTPYTQQPTLDFSTQFALNDNIGTSATDVSISALAQSIITGLTDSLNARVRYVDTTPMLTPYLREVDTATLSSRIDLKANIASPTFTGIVTIPTPFTLDATSVTSTGTQLNYLNSATGTTGTTSTNLVYSTSPTLITPTLGVASATSLNTGTTLNGTIFAKSANLVSLASTNHALTAGNEASGLNMAFGLYSTSLGIQARNNGVASNIFYNPLGGSVGVGDGSLTGQRIFLVTNTGSGTGDWSSIEVRNAAASTDALRLYTLGPGFTTSVTNVQDGAAVTTGTGLSGGLSVGTQASADLRLYTNNTLRWTMAGSTGNITATGQFVSSGGGIGYTTGAGGTATQGTSRTTTVVNNKLCGTITMFSAAQAADALVTFTLINSFIAATDFILVQHISATNGGAWSISVVAGAGSATINIRNVSNASITEATPLRFTIIKATTN